GLATGAGNPSIAGLSTISLVTAAPNSIAPLRLNSGGPTYTDPAGHVWTADTGFFTDNCPFGGPTTTFTPPAGLDGEYATVRGCFNGIFQGMSYTIPVPNDYYLVTLKFAEPNFANAGQRIFRVSVNGVTNDALLNLDVAARAGGQYKPWDTVSPVAGPNGQISLGFPNLPDNPIINAIEIMPLGGVEVLPTSVNLWQSQTRQFYGKVADPANSTLNWTLTPSAGSITTAGLFTAPAAIATAQSVTVTATDSAYSTWTNTATVNLYPPVQITLTPATSTVTGGQTKQITATLAHN